MKRPPPPQFPPGYVPQYPRLTRLETFPDPDFVEPDFGPVKGAIEFDEQGRCTLRPLTAEEQAEEDALRTSRPARIAALKAKKKQS